MSFSSPKPSPQRRGRIKLETKLDDLLEPREQLVARIEAASTKRANRLVKAEKRYRKEVGDAIEGLTQLNEEMASFMERNHYQLTRRLSKTIRRKMGDVKVVLRAAELEMPGSEAPVIDFLLARPGGKRYLLQTWRVNRRALLQAPQRLLRQLAPFGVWRGQHRLISVKSPSENTPLTLSQRRFNEHRH